MTDKRKIQFGLIFGDGVARRRIREEYCNSTIYEEEMKVLARSEKHIRNYTCEAISPQKSVLLEIYCLEADKVMALKEQDKTNIDNLQNKLENVSLYYLEQMISNPKEYISNSCRLAMSYGSIDKPSPVLVEKAINGAVEHLELWQMGRSESECKIFQARIANLKKCIKLYREQHDKIYKKYKDDVVNEMASRRVFNKTMNNFVKATDKAMKELFSEKTEKSTIPNKSKKRGMER